MSTPIRMLLLGLVHHHAKLTTVGTPQWVQTVREVLNDRWDKRVTLEELSAICDIHPVTISRYFPAYFSATFGDYCRMLKIRHAVSLIRAKQIDLSTIAYACGFSDQSQFIRNFKSLTGMLPATWQKA